MIVVLAAALAYRYHCTPEGESTEIERKLSEHWQRTETFRQTSTDLVKSALSCGAILSDSVEQKEEYYSIHSTTNMSSPSDEQESLAAVEYTDGVRQEWIDAVFGRDFFTTPDYQAPRQGVGLAQIPSYTAYTATIPPGSDKVGMTLSNIAIGVHVREVQYESEAYIAGIQEGSVLVSLNNLGMLGEPTKQALERLWQYEGLFDSVKREHHPVEMTFIKDGELYSVLLLSSAPFGISWASCGQFPLVQRSYSFAAKAGVRRGSLVAAINTTSMRHMDHQVAAQCIQELVQHHEEIHLTLVYTPAASRTSHVEKNTTNVPNKRTAVSTEDGVEVRVHPLAYSIGTLFQKGATTTKQSMIEGSNGSVSQLASQVASGVAVAPSGVDKNTSVTLVTSDKVYPPCPSLASVVAKWNPWDALAYCLLFEASTFHDLVVTPHDSKLQAMQSTRDYEPFLLASINLVCESGSQQFMAKLLDQSEENAAFQQTLYYLLQSYIATLESHTRVDGDVMEILQAAQMEVTDRMQADESIVSVPTTTTTTKRDALVNGGNHEMAAAADKEDAIVEVSGTNGSGKIALQQSAKKKSVFRVFKRKGSKSSLGGGKSPKVKSPKAKPKSPPPEPSTVVSSSSPPTAVPEIRLVPVSALFDNMTRFLQELDSMCDTVEKSLLKSISQKIADWALQPWSLSKQKALVAVTEGMRDALLHTKNLPVVNPIESLEVLTAVDPRECYILPSAHFPLLLTFHVTDKETAISQEQLYRTRVEVVSLRGAPKSPVKVVRLGSKGNNAAYNISRTFFVQGAVSGVVKESGRR